MPLAFVSPSGCCLGHSGSCSVSGVASAGRCPQCDVADTYHLATKLKMGPPRLEAPLEGNVTVPQGPPVTPSDDDDDGDDSYAVCL